MIQGILKKYMFKLLLPRFKLRLFKKALVPVPTKTGLLIIFCLMFITALFAITTIHPFLAVNQPVSNSTLIVEGWLPDYCLDRCAKLFLNDTYTAIMVTGGPLEQGSYLKEYKTYADLGAASLRALSIPDSCLHVIPAGYSPVDRTYASASALKKWINTTGFTGRTFTLCSHSTHTRRSTLFFKRALGKEFTIGSLAIDDRDYDAEKWWMSSKGVRSVIEESIAYIYGLFFVTFKVSGTPL